MSLFGRKRGVEVRAFPARTHPPVERRLVMLFSSGPRSPMEAALALGLSGDDLDRLHEGLKRLVDKGVITARRDSDGVLRYGYQARLQKGRPDGSMLQARHQPRSNDPTDRPSLRLLA